MIRCWIAIVFTDSHFFLLLAAYSGHGRVFFLHSEQCCPLLFGPQPAAEQSGLVHDLQ